MKTQSYGKLINKAGKGSYTKPESLDNVIRYITRTNRSPKDDLIAWGGLGILESENIDSIVAQFRLVQKLHTRRGRFGRYVDHEVFSLTPEGENLLAENNIDIDCLAREMARDFYDNDHCQILYGVHSPEEEGKHTHIHFAINTVGYTNGQKRRENKGQTNARNRRFQEIVASSLSKERF